MIKKIAPFVGCYLICRLAYQLVFRLVPIYSPFSSFRLLLGEIVFWLSAFLFVSQIVVKIKVSIKKLTLVVFLSCFADAVGGLLEHITRNPFISLLFYLGVWLLLPTLLLCKKADRFKTIKGCFALPGTFTLPVLFLLNLPLFPVPRHSGIPMAHPFVYVMLADLSTASSDYLLPQFTFFSWTVIRIRALLLSANNHSDSVGAEKD